MSGYYTSMELSQELAAAGVSQDPIPTGGAYYLPGAVESMLGPHVVNYDAGGSTTTVRAMRLDEVLGEIERERPEWGLSVETSEGCEANDNRHWVCSVIGVDDFVDVCGDTPVEAAGRVLLALLRERGEAKA